MTLHGTVHAQTAKSFDTSIGIGAYIGVGYINVSNFPLSWEGDIYSGQVGKTKNSASAAALSIGFSIVTPTHFYLGLENEIHVQDE